MKKFWTGLIIVLISFQLSSQDLNEKKKQLEKLNEKISQEQELIRQKEEEKKQTEKDLQLKEQQKKEAEKKVRNLQKSEKSTKNVLDGTIEELRSTASFLQDLTNLCEKEVNNLVIAHYQSEIFPEKKLECRFLASLVAQTTNEINEISGKKQSLESKQKKVNRDYEDLVWTRIVTNKKSKEYKNEISSLQTNISQIDKDKAAALARKNQLEEDAAALDELITKLQTEILNEDFSYQFSTAKLIWPVKGKILRPFGEQHSAEYKVSTINNGIDISVAEGTSVQAVDDGVVAFAEWYNGAGKLVIIDHKNGFYTLYSHNNSLLVSKGESVKKNQVIAYTGKTGSVEEPCLHFEIRKRGNPVDPMDWLE
ncbi:MAG: peptidoglycan DD-metalloendopeptidase family protein [Candidatus Cloacimonadales bacterium]|nr:peptidoglycan DD-metalloendopeptidase family protein [Candidatus Cloacimonadales bacterium]